MADSGQNAGGDAGAGGNKVKVTAPTSFTLSDNFKAASPSATSSAISAGFVDMAFMDDQTNCVEKKGSQFQFEGTFSSGPEKTWMDANKGQTVNKDMKIVIRDQSKLDATSVAGIIQEAPFTFVSWVAGGANDGAKYGKNDSSHPYYFDAGGAGGNPTQQA
jgi:hypothetical protein